MLSTRVFEGATQFEQLAVEWKALANHSPAATPFQTFEWQSLWLRHYGKGAQSVVVAAYDGDALIGIYPLFRKNAAWRVLRPMGVGPSDYLPPLLKPGYEEAACLAIDTALGQLKGVDLIDLHQIRESHPFATGVNEASEAITQARCLVLDLPRSYEDYLAMLGKSLRYDVRRLDKALFKDGRAVIEVASPETATQFFADFMTLHEKRWKARGQWWGGAFVGRAAPFHKEWVQIAANNGWLRMSRLLVDGEPAGVIYGMAYGATTYFYQSGFDPAQKAYSPGTLLVAHTIRRAIEEGHTSFDFMRGDEPYKRRWKPQHEYRNLRSLRVVGTRGIAGNWWNRRAAELEEKVRTRLEGRSPVTPGRLEEQHGRQQ